ncbi:hypothetical protein [Parvibaculum sp.]|uniref:hypothetical protein n=1 Tax=Parvibaculum sp. TaxID=2024848 RepID=UPI000C58072A|nr:hypothetical protein [Parvibaculum sp.]MAM95699.1 hypothetical protein [Parvibaculum sp.]HCX68564.1 hypothetical protein [Rhodobiaceae bacterium]|tara:strand:- start:24516 stop:25094 length:579 start_codon:yes stop_codon:yes gene_type:complete
MTRPTLKDFTPTKETISLHGLGFLQIRLTADMRMHVWHPELPRRRCFEYSAVHNHRFSFTSRVLKGTQVNRRCDLEIVKPETGSHLLISHNGPRSEKGSRLSYPVADANVIERPIERYAPGEAYFMPAYEYHHTPCDGIVVTVIQKHEEHTIHANSVCRRGVEFDYDFDRFQLSRDELFSYVMDALQTSEVT